MRSPSDYTSLESLRILVVDDHSINREFLASALRPVSARVDIASSGAEAIARCARFEYDLILMDLHMPEQDGLETATAIQAQASGQGGSTIVFLTADTRAEEHQRLREAGFMRVLHKPLSLDTLLRQLQSWFDVGINQASLKPQRATSEQLIDDESGLEACHGQADLLLRMKSMLAAELKDGLVEIDRQIEAGELQAVTATLHQWMGAAGYAGASGLGRQCKTLKAALDDGNSAARAQAYVDFIRSAQATQCALGLEPG